MYKTYQTPIEEVSGIKPKVTLRKFWGSYLLFTVYSLSLVIVSKGLLVVTSSF